jgi:uncharacterized protein (DUF302 family)
MGAVGAFSATIDLPADEAEAAVRAALAANGFGILTEIDVAAVLRARLGVERPPLKILGACNPELAHRALEVDPAAALVLPCNVVLDRDEEGRLRVQATDPRTLITDPALAVVAAEAAAKLGAALASLAEPDTAAP